MQRPQFHLGFSTLDKEEALRDLPVAGAFPPWLSGTLVRNGPAKFEVGAKRLRHWFDGFAMLHAFSIKNGRVSYANKFLETNAHRSARGKDDISYSEFATDPCRSLFKRFTQAFYRTPTDNANVNIARVADAFVALTETPLPTLFDPVTLKTAGVFHYEDALKSHLATAHPHYDFERRESVGYLTRFSYRSRYHVYAVPAGSRARRTIATIAVKEPAYIHSFGITKNYAVLAEYPLVINPADLLFRGKPFIENFRWQSKRGTRFFIINRNSGDAIRIETDAFFAFHHVNAYEDGQEIVLDIVAYNDPAVIDSLYLDVLRGETPRPLVITGELRRYRLSPAQSSARFDVISDQRLELPRVNYRAANTNPYRFVYGTGRDEANPNDFLNRLVKVDTVSGNALVWREEECYPGEPVYITSSSRARDEDGGIVLSVVLNVKKNNSFLLALDARSFRGVARAEAPHHIPFGFHGQFFSNIL